MKIVSYILFRVTNSFSLYDYCSTTLITFPQCDDKCGLSQETRTTYCATQDGTVYPDEKCNVEKPELVRDCESKKECEVLWFASQWSDVSLLFIVRILATVAIQ